MISLEQLISDLKKENEKLNKELVKLKKLIEELEEELDSWKTYKDFR
jgi:cell division protein FtsB